MTETGSTQACRWCGRPFAIAGRRGRPRKFCTQACRQKDYISRLRAQDAGLAETELVITRTELEDLRDRLYVLECTIGDVRRDLAEGDDPRIALDAVIEAAEPLFGTPLGERST